MPDKTSFAAQYEVDDCYTLVNKMADNLADAVLYGFYNRGLDCPAAQRFLEHLLPVYYWAAALTLQQRDPDNLEAFFSWVTAFPEKKKLFDERIDAYIDGFISSLPEVTFADWEVAEVLLLARYMEYSGYTNRPQYEAIKTLASLASASAIALKKTYDDSIRVLGNLRGFDLAPVTACTFVTARLRFNIRYILEHAAEIPDIIWEIILQSDVDDFLLTFLALIAVRRERLRKDPQQIAATLWRLCHKYITWADFVFDTIADFYDDFPEDWRVTIVEAIKALQAYTDDADPLVWGLATALLIRLGVLEPDQNTLEQLHKLIMTYRAHAFRHIQGIGDWLYNAITPEAAKPDTD